MLSWSKRESLAAALIAVATALGGCVTGTEVSYSEYQYDRYGVRIRAGPPCGSEAFGRALAISTSIWTVL
jgi:hypothetical protein